MADVLAWESAADEVNVDPLDSEFGGGKLPHVVEDWDGRPVSPEYGAAVGIDLAEGDGSHPGSLEAQADGADAAEQIKYPHYRWPLGSQPSRVDRSRPYGPT
jgi:hypothetical protein